MKPFLNVSENQKTNFNEVYIEYYKKLPEFKVKINYDKSYYKEVVNFELNSYGYRTKHILTDEYALALGCSHTYGTGLHEDERYSNLIENEIKIPIINLGRPGTAINFALLNLLNLITSNYKLPKFIILQSPSIFRLSLPRPDSIRNILPYEKKFKSLYVDESIETHSIICYDLITKICKKEKIKLISFSYHKLNTVGNFFIKPVDAARDNDHYGPSTQIDIKNNIVEML